MSRLEIHSSAGRRGIVKLNGVVGASWLMQQVRRYLSYSVVHCRGLYLRSMMYSRVKWMRITIWWECGTFMSPSHFWCNDLLQACTTWNRKKPVSKRHSFAKTQGPGAKTIDDVCTILFQMISWCYIISTYSVISYMYLPAFLHSLEHHGGQGQCPQSQVSR